MRKPFAYGEHGVFGLCLLAGCLKLHIVLVNTQEAVDSIPT